MNTMTSNPEKLIQKDVGKSKNIMIQIKSLLPGPEIHLCQVWEMVP